MLLAMTSAEVGSIGTGYDAMSLLNPPGMPASLPALLRAGRNAYVTAIATRLREAGFDDLPRDGVFTISAIGRGDVSASGLAPWLGISRQAVSQLLDTLVLRGYVERLPDDRDRRRMRLVLTDRGRAVAVLCRQAVERIDERLVELVGPEAVLCLRRTLEMLAALAERSPSLAHAADGEP